MSRLVNSYFVKFNLSNQFRQDPKNIARKGKKLPLRSLGARPLHADISTEPGPRLRQDFDLALQKRLSKAMRAGAHALSIPPAGGLGADIGMLKKSSDGEVTFANRNSRIAP